MKDRIEPLWQAIGDGIVGKRLTRHQNILRLLGMVFVMLLAALGLALDVTHPIGCC